MPEDKECVVTVTPGRPVADVAHDLARLGFVLGEELAEIGVITGHCPKQLMDRLRSVPGVADVAESAPVDIGPPSSPDTW